MGVDSSPEIFMWEDQEQAQGFDWVPELGRLSVESFEGEVSVYVPEKVMVELARFILRNHCGYWKPPEDTSCE